MPGEITSEQLPQLIEESNQLLTAVDAYLRQFLISIKNAPETPEITGLKKVAEKKFRLIQQWKILSGNADAWPRQKLYVAQSILIYLRQPDFDFQQAVRDISEQFKRGETEARQQTLAAATQVAMGMPYLFAQMSGAEPMFKLVFGQDMFGKNLTGWERVKAAGEVALGAAMVYLPAKYLDSLNVPKTTPRINETPVAPKIVETPAGQPAPLANEDRTKAMPGYGYRPSQSEMQGQVETMRANRADDIEQAVVNARAKGVNVEEVAGRYGIDPNTSIEEQLAELSSIEQEQLTDRLTEALSRAELNRLRESIRTGEEVIVVDGEFDTGLVQQALIRQQAAERNPAEMTLEDYKNIREVLLRRWTDPAFRAKVQKGVLRDVDADDTSFRPFLDDADRARLGRMMKGEQPAFTPRTRPRLASLITPRRPLLSRRPKNPS